MKAQLRILTYRIRGVLNRPIRLLVRWHEEDTSSPFNWACTTCNQHLCHLVVVVGYCKVQPCCSYVFKVKAGHFFKLYLLTQILLSLHLVQSRLGEVFQEKASNPCVDWAVADDENVEQGLS